MLVLNTGYSASLLVLHDDMGDALMILISPMTPSLGFGRRVKIL